MNEAGIKVSIIIPVYNGANFLREAIDSALAQTYENTEVIVVNDGSDDGGETEKIALSYGDRIKYFAKENGGVSSALNYGIEQMTGNWFSWLSHDDLYLPKKIQSAVEKITQSRNSVDKFVVLNKSVLINSDGSKRNRPLRRIGKGILTPLDAYKKLASRNNINGCAVLVPKIAFTEAGYFSTDYKYVQDTDFWIRLILCGYSFVVIDKVLTKTRIHPEQVSVKIPATFYTENEQMGFSIINQIFGNMERYSDFLLPVLESSIIQENDKISTEIVNRLKKNHEYSAAARITVFFAKIKMHVTNVIRYFMNQKPIAIS